MNIAIASEGNTMDSCLGSSFGRSSWFVIYDCDTRDIEFLSNPNKHAEQNAGLASVQLLSSRNIKKIISGEFGLKIKPLLDSLKIQMIVVHMPEKKIKEILEMLNH